MPDVQAKPLPAMPYLQIDDNGAASLQGSRCKSCGAVIPGKRNICACCGARDKMDHIRLGEHGKLFSYTIVRRSFPGVKTPFVAVVVDLDGGGTLQGTLTDFDPDAEAIQYDMPLDVVYRDSGQRDSDGRPFISHYFVPSKGEA